ncbi:uncharacterized protein SAPINGB_P000898 [Magnusiomyces paraingens]|uniref:R3H domain-containing protein n=1 Tax=Magnusiomyces paraingens TaxID=2606893 RepID=A0A5E8B4Q3_9ASCO|nr:uncharacterized protein SAPINGB_P000898 [Saprochaete ingens]VVT45802.1 unnamed protein product [Saprochaete ingens]
MPDLEVEHSHEDCHGHDHNHDHKNEHQHHQQQQHAHVYDKLDLAESLLAEIEDGQYICLVCADELDAKSPIWNCSVCYRVYHLPCIKQWAEKSLAFRADSPDPTVESWKCPSCSTTSSMIPREYRCWCKKELNPTYDGIAPHSCGQTCAAPLSCIHKCMAICHPGPHPECTALGPMIKCYCAKKSKQLPCILTSYSGWQCNNICGELLPCGMHKCQKKCHQGLCGDCSEKINATCYCGETVLPVTCNNLEPKQSVEIDAETGKQSKSWIGFFVCDKIQEGKYECNVHSYKLECNKRTADTYKCPLRPVEGETCPCGKSPVTDILGHPRSSCEETIPTCGQVCDKKLKCGHTCKYPCHEGECPRCYFVTDMRCRCGYNRFLVPCGFAVTGEKPICARRCTGNLNCRRHRCTNVCCEFEKKAIKYGKNAVWGKGYSVYDETIEREYKEKHGCTQTCNAMLNCGKHRCNKECHVRPCGPCLESSSEDWVCPCGRTILRAPVRCGTMLPTCPYECTRPTLCGHPTPKHPCHGDDKECDRCLRLVSKPCACGKNPEVKNVPCYQEYASCGQLCGKPMACGHPCPKMCHRPGECETKCSRCAEVHILGCKCGEISRTIPCKATAADREMNLLIPCEESCLEAARRRQLAEAFGMDPARQAPGEFEYSDNVIDLYLANPGWCTSTEKKIRDFALCHVGNGDNGTNKVLRFPPMKKYDRMFIHELATAYNIRSQSYDPEPQRNVVLFAPQRSGPTSGSSTPGEAGTVTVNGPVYIPRLTVGRYITEHGIA